MILMEAKAGKGELQKLVIFVELGSFKYMNDSLHLAGKYAWPWTLSVPRSEHREKLWPSRSI